MGFDIIAPRAQNLASMLVSLLVIYYLSRPYVQEACTIKVDVGAKARKRFMYKARYAMTRKEERKGWKEVISDHTDKDVEEIGVVEEGEEEEETEEEEEEPPKEFVPRQIGEKKKLTTNGYVPKVMLETFKKQNCVVLKISDNGIGISGENINKVFLPFFSTKSLGKGQGLGLSIASRIIHEFEGQIELCSDSKTGTTFIVEIPIGNS